MAQQDATRLSVEAPLISNRAATPSSPPYSSGAATASPKSVASTRRSRSRNQSLARVMAQGARHLQLQLETIPPYGARILFYSWYFVLLIAFILQLGTWQWECINICGNGSCDLSHFSSWTSSDCSRQGNSSDFPSSSDDSRTKTPVPMAWNVTTTASPAGSIVPTPTEATEYTVIWGGSFSGRFDAVLNRFVHFMFTVPRPEGVDGTASFDMEFKLVLFDLDDAASVMNHTIDYVFRTTIIFIDGRNRCEIVTLPTSTTTVSNTSRVVLSALHVPAVLLNSTLEASVAAVFQNAQYTIATIAIRYILIALVIAHMIRSSYHNVTAINGFDQRRLQERPARFEQAWVLALQCGLLLYLNPLFALGVFITPQPAFFAFLEFRIPLYFVTLVVCFMFALISAAMAWSDSSTFAPPYWTQAVNIMLLVIVIVLDIVDAANKGYDWGLEQCPNFQCTPVGYITYGLIILYVLICSVWLRYLRNNLGKKSYLSSRPQQLAMRLFIFIFSTYAIYYVVSSIVVVFVYKGISSVVQYQGLLQIGVICVSFTFVTIMTFSFTYVLRTEGVPIHASDRRWKKVKWPDKWFHWVALHGGVGYIFFNEMEERRFWRIQAGQRADEDENASRPFFNVAQETAAPPKIDPAAPEANDSSDDGDIDDCEWDEIAHNGSPSTTAAPGAGYSAFADEPSATDDNDSKTLLGKATAAAFAAPGKLLKRLEEGLVETAIYLHIFTADRVPFFCLETCIDALNLAWEAYGVTACAGDAEVPTGVDLTTLFPGCCCCNRQSQDDDVARSSGMRDDGTSGGDSSVLLSPVQSRQANTPKARQLSYNAMATPSERSRSNTLTIEGSEVPLRSENAVVLAPLINTEQYGYSNVAVYLGLDVQVVISLMDTGVARHKGKAGCIAVAFRGTNNLSNAVQDARFILKEWDAMKGEVGALKNTTKVLQPRVHSGFLEVWTALREVVLTKVHELREQHPAARLLITGHSLGGAIATFCAYELQQDCRMPAAQSSEDTSFLTRVSMAFRSDSVGGDERRRYSPPMVYTFGMPRVGNGTFRDVFNRRVPHFFRVVNESDAVSHLSIMGGAHVGIEVDIDRHGNYIISPMFIERMFRPTKGRGSSIAHHSMVGYADSLNMITSKSGMGVCPSMCLVPYVDVVMVVRPETPPAAASAESAQQETPTLPTQEA